MTPTLLGAWTIPGTELSAVSDRVARAFGIPKGDAADFVEKVLQEYPDAAKAAGGPYVKGTAAGAKIAASIVSATGVSSGRVVQTLNELAYLVSVGKVALSTYNPMKYSIAAKAKSAAKTALGTAKSAVKAVTPDAVEDVASGFSKGLSGLGDVLALAPLAAVVGLGVWAYSQTKKGSR
jgi:hypothetical protein